MRLLFTFFFVFCSFLLYAFDFSSMCSTSQTLYYNVIDSVGYKVSVIYPGPSIDSAYLNYDQPSGDLVIPSRVTYNGQQYLVTKIESCAFAKCTELNGKLELPYSITSIGDYAFLQCRNMQVLYFNCEHCTRAFAAFEGCEFDTIHIGNSVTIIPEGVFSNSKGISKIQIPASVQSIEDRAFYNCPNLERIDFSDSIVTIGKYAFSDCPLLETVSAINADCIDDYAFFNAPLLQSISLGDDVSNIGDLSFFSCQGLLSLSIGRKVQEIGNYAFYKANSIDTIMCFVEHPPLLGEESFSNQSQYACLIVNCDAVDLYQVSPGWNIFSNIVADRSYSLECVANQLDYGYVSGSGNGFCYGESINIEAIPNNGFCFEEWSDGVTSNPREIVILSDTLFMARFAANPIVGIEESSCCEELIVVTIGKNINVSTSCPSIIQAFDIVGRCVYRSMEKEDGCSFTVSKEGVYVVVADNGNIKKTIIGR